VTISVVVPTRDRPWSLARCLDALAAQDADRLELVVVDDGSRDRGAVEATVATAPGTRLLRTPGRGPGTARNLGARAARGDVVCFTDDDCEPDRGWVRRLAAAARGAGGIAGGRTVAPPGASAAVRASQAISAHLQLDSADGSQRRGRGRPTDRPRVTSFAPSCNLAVTRDVIAMLLFDESYPDAAGEDRDWCDRARAAGYAIAYEPDAVVVHRQRLGAAGFLRQQFRYGRGSARYRRGDPERRLAAPGFHGRLVRRGFRDGAVTGGLVLASQVATAAGVLAERISAPRSRGDE
jgi:glycosyltransferase involved in cell wall biosynthesis